MKRLIAALPALALMAGMALGDDRLPLIVQLKWAAPAPSAGYHIAQKMGFYQDEGLDVTLMPGGPDIAPVQVLASGGADVIVEWMPAALLAREHGLPITNIAQPFSESGLMLICRRDSGIADPARDFLGRTIATWFGGSELPLLNWLNRLGLSTEGGAAGVTVLKQETGAEQLRQHQADCISSVSHDPPARLSDAGFSADDLVTFRFADHGMDVLEDGLYTLETTMQDRPRVTAMVRFVRASMKGWEYAAAHPEEVAGMLNRHDDADPPLLPDQAPSVTGDMVGGAARQVGNPTGRLAEADFQRTIDTLTQGPAPLLGRTPDGTQDGAWIPTITDRAFD